MINNFGDYVGAVADYIEKEYNPDDFQNLNDDEKWTIRTMLESHYHYDNAVSNASNDIIHYLRSSRN